MHHQVLKIHKCVYDVFSNIICKHNKDRLREELEA